MSDSGEMPPSLKSCSRCGAAQHRSNKYCVVCLASFAAPFDEVKYDPCRESLHWNIEEDPFE